DPLVRLASTVNGPALPKIVVVAPAAFVIAPVSAPAWIAPPPFSVIVALSNLSPRVGDAPPVDEIGSVTLRLESGVAHTGRPFAPGAWRMHGAPAGLRSI